jgi:P27 family predicted phage terminase small subunit
MVQKIEGFTPNGRIETQFAKESLLEIKMPNMGSVFVPPHIHEDAQDLIENVLAHMPDGILKNLDTYALASYACAWAIHKRAALQMSDPEFELVTFNQNTGVGHPNPWIKIMFEAGNQMARLGARLGLDPISRDTMFLQRVEHNRAHGQGGKFSGLIGQNG